MWIAFIFALSLLLAYYNYKSPSNFLRIQSMYYFICGLAILVKSNFPKY